MDININVIDGSNLVHRSYFIAAGWIKLTDPSDPRADEPGFPTTEKEWIRLVRMATLTTTIQSIAIMLEKYEAHGCLLPLDLDNSIDTSNKELLSTYHEKDYDSKKYAVINWVRATLLALMPKFGVTTAGAVGVEADDFGYIISRMKVEDVLRVCKIPYTSDANVRIRMFTKDHDWYQSINDHTEWVNAETWEVRDLPLVMEWWGVYWRLTFLATKSLLGDKSDGIPNIPKIGEGKSDICRTWIYDTSTGQPVSKEVLIERLGSNMKYVWAKSLIEHYDQLRNNWELVDLERNFRNGTSAGIEQTINAFSYMTAAPSADFDQIQWAEVVGLTESTKLGTAGRRIEKYMRQRKNNFAE